MEIVLETVCCLRCAIKCICIVLEFSVFVSSSTFPFSVLLQFVLKKNAHREMKGVPCCFVLHFVCVSFATFDRLTIKDTKNVAITQANRMVFPFVSLRMFICIQVWMNQLNGMKWTAQIENIASIWNQRFISTLSHSYMNSL